MVDKSSPALITQAQKTNLETAKIDWQDLQRFFAQGLVIVVDRELDLVEIAAGFVGDDSGKIKSLLDNFKVRKAEDNDAKTWYQQNAQLWAVVAAPWVLVQEC